MRPELRIVTRLPLTSLWNDQGDLDLEKQRYVGVAQIANHLRQGDVRFVVANGGDRLNWVSHENVYRFWKEEVKPHLVEPESVEEGFRLEDYPSEYCFTASEWKGPGQLIVILLEKYH